MKVFIWGCYNQGNFGDDLMGIIFSKLFQKEGCQVQCYRLSSYLSSKYQIETTHSVKEAIEWCDIIVIGGGAFFKKEHETHSMINQDLNELSVELNKYDKKLYCVSIGSDNVSSKDELYQPRKEIIENKNFSGGSVRIKSDLATFDLSDTIFIDDIILTLPVALEYLGFDKIKTSNLLKNRTIINFSKKNFLKSLFNIKLWNLLVTSVYFKSHDSDSGIKSEANLPFVSYFENKDPIISSFELSEAKNVTSTKLHVGVAACSFGVGFKSVYGNEKTRTFLKQSQELLDEIDGYYSFNDEVMKKAIFNQYLSLISDIVAKNKL
ncbi:hypothetical protein [Vibrio furnissii]|uniref:hypothetical protein n=1 Tax=Vibrio furnissii TaxID=29494 RepID=UPI001180A86B|nr:hypothetical protein [Vibrio furnissii]TRN21548.1 hypothetical protein DM784_18745 [Vibrio furnissii]